MAQHFINLPAPCIDYHVLDPAQHHRLYCARLAIGALEGIISNARPNGDIGCTAEELSGFLALIKDPLDGVLDAPDLQRFLRQHAPRS